MCTLCSLNTTQPTDFAGRMVEMLNHAAIIQMISLGHRTGLFDGMIGFPPSTSQEIADSLGLEERYVREWLGAMATGHIVDHDPEAGTFWLPQDHADLLTRMSDHNMAVVAQFMPVLASVETDIVECFKEGGGVPYARYPRFHEVMAELSGMTIVSPLIDHVLPVSPGLVEQLDEGIDVLDVGCGRGMALVKMAERFPNSRFVGFDLSEEAVAFARECAIKHGLNNIRFEVRDLTTFHEPDSYDLVTAFDSIHDQADPASVLSGIAASLRQGGQFFMQDIGGASDIAGNMEVPLSPFMYTVSCMHCMTVSLAQGGVGLGAKWGEQLACTMLEDAGFDDVAVCRLEHDVLNAYYIARTENTAA